MEPRNKAKRTAGETDAKRGFRGKDPAEESLLDQRQALMHAMRQEDIIFREHLGKEVFIELEGISSIFLAKLDGVGTDFLKLTNVREISNYTPNSGTKYREFVQMMKSHEETDEFAQPLFRDTTSSLILNKSKIEKMVPVSDYE